MIPKQRLLTTLGERGVVAVIRTESSLDLVAVARTLHKGGCKFVEIKTTVPGALDIIHDAAQKLTDTALMIGAGTVLDAETARAAILAGSQFIVGPVFDAEVVRVCATYGIAVMPGAMTPTEILTAWRSGADVVKVFPGDVGGPGFLKAIKEPLPQIELLPTKGVDFDTARAYIEAGAIAVGAGSCLVSNPLIAARDYTRITENAERLTRIVREAKGSK